MSTVAAFFVFLLIMLALATLAIILDWMGKPIRRTFRPRTTGTPAWLIVDAPMPSEGPGTSPSGYLPEFSPESTAATDQLTEALIGRSEHEPAEAYIEPSEREPVELPALNPVPGQDEPSSPRSWQAGDSIFKLTPRGTPPSITAVRRRYWKNLSERRSSVVFGEENRTLMAVGQAPQRFNPRTGAIEELSLPEPMLRYCWAAKQKPVPTWGDQGLDPFARP